MRRRSPKEARSRRKGNVKYLRGMLIMSDPLIQKIRKRFLELLGKALGIFYFEGHGPDIGIRRQNFLRIAFEEELGLKIREAPSLERQVDFYIK